MQAAELPQLLIDIDVADWLSMPVRRVNDLARNGKIPAARLPDGTFVFQAADLAAWLDSLPRGEVGRGQ